MTVTKLHQNLSQSEINHRAMVDAMTAAEGEYIYRKALFDALLYAPENRDNDAPEEQEAELSDAHLEAAKAYLLTPAPNLISLARKLRDVRAEGLNECGYIIAALEADAWRLAGQSR